LTNLGGTVLDLDAVVDLDTSAFDLDGFPVGQPVIAHGGGTPVHFRPFVPIRARIVGTAHAELGPVTSSAVLVVTLDIRAQEDEIMLLL
jgi:hypothetical protein